MREAFARDQNIIEIEELFNLASFDQMFTCQKEPTLLETASKTTISSSSSCIASSTSSQESSSQRDIETETCNTESPVEIDSKTLESETKSTTSESEFASDLSSTIEDFSKIEMNRVQSVENIPKYGFSCLRKEEINTNQTKKHIDLSCIYKNWNEERGKGLISPLTVTNKCVRWRGEGTQAYVRSELKRVNLEEAFKNVYDISCSPSFNGKQIQNHKYEYEYKYK